MRNEELKELITLHTQGVRAEIKATGDLVNLRINSLEKKIDNNHVVVEQIKKETLVVRLVHRHPKISLLIFFILVCGVIFITTKIEFGDLFSFIKP